MFLSVFSPREVNHGRCKSMESLLVQEQNKNNPIFCADDSSSESNTSEMSRHLEEPAHSPRKHNARSRTPEPQGRKSTPDYNSSPQLSPNFPPNMTHSQSVPALQNYDRLHRTSSKVTDKSPHSRVSYEGSSTAGEYQVRYVGGYRSGPEDDQDEPIQLTTYNRSPSRHRRGPEDHDNVDVSHQRSSSNVSENTTASIQSFHQSREGRVERDVPLNFSRSPSSSPYLRRKASDIQHNTVSTPAPGTVPGSAQKQKKTAIVSPLLDMSDTRPRSVPPGVLMFDPTDPESERIEQVSQVSRLRILIPSCSISTTVRPSLFMLHGKRSFHCRRMILYNHAYFGPPMLTSVHPCLLQSTHAYLFKFSFFL